MFDIYKIYSRCKNLPVLLKNKFIPLSSIVINSNETLENPFNLRSYSSNFKLASANLSFDFWRDTFCI